MRYISITLLLAFSILSGCNSGEPTKSSNQAETPAPENPQAEEATITVDIAFGGARADTSLQVTVEPGATVLEAMKSAEGLEAELKNYAGLGRLIVGIAGVANEDLAEHSWQFCVDGVYATRGVEEVRLEDGQRLSWHYAKYGEHPCKKVGE